MKKLSDTFNDRLTAQNEAKKALLAKFKPKPAATDPLFDKRDEMRAAEREAARQAREAEKEAARQAKLAAEEARRQALLNDEQHQLELKREERKARKAAEKEAAKARKAAKAAERANPQPVHEWWT